MGDIALQAAISGAKVAQARTEVIANNIANISTIGYKKMDIQVADLFYTNLKKAELPDNNELLRKPVGVQVGHGAKIVGTYRNLAQGHMRETSHPLDLAITGPGYFAIVLPNDKIGYTRAGSLKRDPNTGNITTTDGKPLLDDISIPDDIPTENISISKSGLITAKNSANPASPIELGQLTLYTFPNEHGVEAIGGNILVETTASGEAIAIEDITDRILQFWLEESNVTAVEELAALIKAEREYELNSRVMRVYDKMYETANNIK